MSSSTAEGDRLRYLLQTVSRAAHHLATTDRRLFAVPPTLQQIAVLEASDDLAERVDAFVSRFGRLQDLLGDKLLPAILRKSGETIGPLIDNLDRAEKFGLIDSSDQWMQVRRLRNEMIHEYHDDPQRLLAALVKGHSFVPVLLQSTERMTNEARRRLG